MKLTRHTQVAAALARFVEAEHGIFTAVMGEDRKPDEGVVVLLDTSYSMQSTGFAADGDEQEGEEDDDGDDESDDDGEDSISESDSEEEDEEEEEEEQEVEDLGADVKYGLSALPHPIEITCPHELQCPLTQGILLDPVIASDGQVRLSILFFCGLHSPACSILTHC